MALNQFNTILATQHTSEKTDSQKREFTTVIITDSIGNLEKEELKNSEEKKSIISSEQKILTNNSEQPVNNDTALSPTVTKNKSSSSSSSSELSSSNDDNWFSGLSETPQQYQKGSSLEDSSNFLQEMEGNSNLKTPFEYNLLSSSSSSSSYSSPSSLTVNSKILSDNLPSLSSPSK